MNATYEIRTDWADGTYVVCRYVAASIAAAVAEARGEYPDAESAFCLAIVSRGPAQPLAFL